ncbi:MAG: C39 family peptidase [Acidobacteriota bacterium]|nr:C39 family peptidase [Acidobacteriota bacterium]
MVRRSFIAGVLACTVCGLWFLPQAVCAQGVWLNVPFIRQVEDGCGSASLAMVMQYWQGKLGAAVTPAADAVAIQHALYAPRAHGIYATAMKQYLEQHGFRAFAVAGDLALLQHHLEKGRPLIVALEPEKGTPLHYVVVVGLEPEQKVVLVNDPQLRKLLKQDESVFAKQWKATGNWTLLAVPVESKH